MRTRSLLAVSILSIIILFIMVVGIILGIIGLILFIVEKCENSRNIRSKGRLVTSIVFMSIGGLQLLIILGMVALSMVSNIHLNLF